MKHKVGDTMYVPTSMSISNGSDDISGGLATITKIDNNKNLPKGHVNRTFVEFKELPGHSFNYSVLLEEQDKLKKEYGDRKAYPDPDIDTPWIEKGDIVNGKVWDGDNVW